ncbi:MAG: nitroreductase family protein [Thermoprotei archaeon]|mgnify:CR=1 FL=1|nr:MAG: nitroreductase family protein [Thermoprotei archaeon]
MNPEELMRVIRSRRSIRSYENKPVNKELVLRCLEAAIWAPSANNSQPWEFIVVTDPETRRRLANVHRWGRHMSESPIVIVVLANPSKSPRHWRCDCGAAVQNMLLMAHAHGLGSCWIGVHDTAYEEEFRKILKVPEELRIFCAITLGYPAERPSKNREPLESKLHWEEY